MGARPTLRDIAERTGLSTATVSLALRDSPHVPLATRDRIKQAARDIGYRSDPMLAALAAHRWHRKPAASGATLALLADQYLEGHNGMAERAAAYGYRLETFPIRDFPNGRRLSDVLYNRGILGVVAGQIFKPDFCETFDWSRFVAVACSEGYYRPPVNLVMPNHFKAVQEAWDRAWAQGYRRIGMALFDMPSAIDVHDRYAAFLERQQHAPAAARVPVLTIAAGEPGQDSSRHRNASLQQIDRWMQVCRPDMVLGFNDAFQWLIREAGWAIPECTAFLSLWINAPNPAATGLRLYTDELGRRAVDWLDSLLRAGERGRPQHSATMLIDFCWQDGVTETTGASGARGRRRPSS